MRRILLSGVLGSLSIAAQAAMAQEPAPGTITIKSATFAGEGCVGAQSTVTPDNTQITLSFPDFFLAHTGQPGTTQTVTKECQARLRMNVPAGYQFAIASGTGQGQAVLDAKATGSLNVRYGFNPRTPPNKSSAMTIVGPYSNNYSHSFDMKLSSAAWSSCTGTERDLVINTIMGVKTVGAVSGLMTYDSSTYQLKDEYGLVWRQCATKPVKAFAAVCRAQFTAAGKVNETRGQASAKTQALATTRAQARANAKCESRTAEIGGSACTVPVDPCQVLAI